MMAELNETFNLHHNLVRVKEVIYFQVISPDRPRLSLSPHIYHPDQFHRLFKTHVRYHISLNPRLWYYHYFVFCLERKILPIKLWYTIKFNLTSILRYILISKMAKRFKENVCIRTEIQYSLHVRTIKSCLSTQLCPSPTRLCRKASFTNTV